MIRVLIVEDEDLIRQGLKLTTDWTALGCELAGEASDGEEGRKMILKLKPDLVIADIKMPKMDGLKMIESLRDEISCEYIILSGYDEFSYAKQAIRMRVSDYLLKPIDDRELERAVAGAVKNILEKREVLRNLSGRKAADREVGTEGTGFHNLQDKYLLRACELLRHHYAEELTLKSVAEALDISGSYLGKLFRSRTGYTFLEVLTLYRIQKAVELLRDTDLKVYEVSYEVGYGDSKYFSRIFHKITGMNPMDIKNGRRLPENHILNQL